MSTLVSGRSATLPRSQSLLCAAVTGGGGSCASERAAAIDFRQLRRKRGQVEAHHPWLSELGTVRIFPSSVRHHRTTHSVRVFACVCVRVCLLRVRACVHACTPIATHFHCGTEAVVGGAFRVWVDCAAFRCVRQWLVSQCVCFLVGAHLLSVMENQLFVVAARFACGLWKISCAKLCGCCC